MKLSEAIRRGSRVRGMATSDFFAIGPGGISSCALGAAYEATNTTSHLRLYLDGSPDLKSIRAVDAALCGQWPQLHEVWVIISSDVREERLEITFQEIIQEMNDSELFTREEIADWLESIGE